MKINRVDLQNFRNHEWFTVEFEDGINLLLGPNGSGKSSVLEAIGIALFGSSGRSNLESAIKYGEKFAKIKVEFTGIDGLEYVVDRELNGSSLHVLYSKANPREKIKRSARGKREESLFWEKIRSLTGVSHHSEIKTIYQNVITAYQNQIVDAFLLSNKEKQSLFNAIFNTEIYRTLYEKFLLDLSKEYEKEVLRVREQIRTREGMLRDPSELKKEREDIEIKIADQERALKETEEQLAACEKIQKDMEEKKNKIEKIHDDIELRRSTVDKLGEEIGEKEKNLDAARKSREIILDKKESFEKYLRLKKESDELSEKLKRLEKLSKKERELQQTVNELENEIDKGKNDILNFQENLCRMRERIENEKKKYDEQQRVISSNKEKKAILTERRMQIENLKKKLERIQKEEEVLNIELENIQKELKKLGTEMIPDEDKINGILSSLEKSRQQLEKERKELKNLCDSKAIFVGNIKFLEESEMKMSSGVCPFLMEECKNIQEKGSVREYFVERREELYDKIAQLEEHISRIDDVDGRLDSVKEEIMKNREKIEKNKNIRNELEKANLRFQLFTEKKKNIESELQCGCQEAEKIVPLCVGISDFRICREKVGDALTEVDREIAHISSIIDVEGKNNKIREGEISSLEREIKDVERKEKVTSEKIGKCECEKKTHISKIKDLLEMTKDFEAVKDQAEKIRIELNNLQTDYDLYMQNRDMAQRVDEFQNSLERQKKERDEQNFRIGHLESLLVTLKESYSLNVYEEILRDVIIKRQEKEKNAEELGGIRNQKKSIEKRIVENEGLIREQEKSKRYLNILGRKMELMKSFRENVKELGKYVSESLMMQVSLRATENFRQLTGRTERITWENNDNESYAVYLIKGKEEKRTSFKDLSGGEQVVVALSMRSAITTLLTKVRFSIFDEPTINLDSQRREALAMYLREILRDINQAIIVTHDGSFEEMAKKVIRL